MGLPLGIRTSYFDGIRQKHFSSLLGQEKFMILGQVVLLVPFVRAGFLTFWACICSEGKQRNHSACFPTRSKFGVAV